MLAKPYRFHSRGGVKYTYRHGTTVRGNKISLIYNRNSRHKQRFAVVVSKKVLKSAVGRNRIRRRIYESIRHQLPNFTTHADCIFVVYSSDFLSLPASEINSVVTSLLSQVVL